MPSLADVVDVVIGVDTHEHTHTAAVVDATTGGVLTELTVNTDPGGYQQLLEVGARHGARAWALEGAGGYGAGLARHLSAAGEQVIELDRPVRATRRHGAKSDPLDAARAAREALGRVHLAQLKTDGPRGQLAALMAARRSAVEAASLAQRQLHALVIAAPESLRALFRGQSTTVMTTTAARLRTRTALGRAHHHDDHGAARSGSTRERAAGGGARPRDRDGGHRAGLAPGPARPARDRGDRRRAGPDRLVPPRADPLGSRVRDARRNRPDPGLVRDEDPSPAQPVR